MLKKKINTTLQVKLTLVDLSSGSSLAFKIKTFPLWFHMDITLPKNAMSPAVITCIHFLIFVSCIDILISVEHAVSSLLQMKAVGNVLGFFSRELKHKI